MEKFKPNWDTLRKTITVLNEDNSIYAEYDYIDWLQFKLEYLTNERLHQQTFYVRNEYGGIDKIDDGGNPIGYDDFSIVRELYHKIIKAQIEPKLKKLKDNGK